ncbi:MAG: Enamidase [Candidatus Hecatellales archaeon]|nr:MAG: Enamidase [Candidatus Hecatellales archaeon]
MVSIALTNIGKIVTGDIENPLAEGDTIIVEDGKIREVGRGLNVEGCDQVYDCSGMTVTPGLIDSHAHIAIGDFTPRQLTINFIESEMHGGVTSMISAGEVHVPGRPRDAAGVKALAILNAKAFQRFRPGGVKVLGGALILEPGLTEKDFEEMAREGVRLIGEIGLGKVFKPEHGAAEMVRWARKYGIKSMMHTGGTSLADVPVITAEDVLAVNPDVASHVNGGPTAPPLSDAEKIIREGSMAVEIVQCGNPKAAVEVLRMARENNALHRVIMGNDAPSGTGVIPLGILRNICLAASLAGIPAETAFAMATGNTARVYELPRGMVKPGLEADLLVMDAPIGSVGGDALKAVEAGDIPGIALIMIDGEVKTLRSRNTPPASRKVKQVKG